MIISFIIILIPILLINILIFYVLYHFKGTAVFYLSIIFTISSLFLNGGTLIAGIIIVISLIFFSTLNSFLPKNMTDYVSFGGNFIVVCFLMLGYTIYGILETKGDSFLKQEFGILNPTKQKFLKKMLEKENLI